jgi:pimeloyl-ACP methyl ester carboxylesterase
VPDRVDDLIVILPGILGSVLERDGAPIWDHSLAAMRHLMPPRRLVDALRLESGIGDHAPGDGVRAVGLIKGLHIVPGLWSIDGYAGLLRYLRKTLDLDRGNLLTFPYDWRLSNIVNATRLARAVEDKLSDWRQTVPDAQVIYICHSMGGLIARYYLDVLGGHATARRLITIGTPHQGAAKAAVALSLGLAPAARGRLGRFGSFLDELGEVLAEFPSVHQLLPTYRCIQKDGLHRLSDVGLPGIATAAIRNGTAFHQEIADRQNEEPSYGIHLFGGHGHKTLLSIRHDAAGITPLHTWATDSPRGDGTVPRFSAALPQSTDDTVVRYSADRHSALASSGHLHAAVHAIITAHPIRTYQAQELTLALDLPEIALTGEEMAIDVESDDDRLPLVVTAVHDETGDLLRGPVFRNLGHGRYRTDLQLPKPGAWRLTVKCASTAPVSPVTEIVIAVASTQEPGAVG